MERIRCARAIGRGIGERIDDLQLLDDRAGPSVVDDERQRIFVFRTNVDEVKVEPVDLGYELRQGVQLRLAVSVLRSSDLVMCILSGATFGSSLPELPARRA